MGMNRRQFVQRAAAVAGACLAGAARGAGAGGDGGEYDLVVVGGGSAGVGAALAAARRRVRVLLVEKADCLGGTSTRGGVHEWASALGATGVPFDLYKRLKKVPGAAGISSFGRHASWYDPAKEKYRFPGGERVIDPSRRYVDTLHGSGGRTLADREYLREHLHGVAFEPDAMARVMKEALEATGCRVELDTAFVRAGAEGGRVRWIELAGGRRVAARFYIDATGDGWLCESAGCEMMTGQEARATFDEPHAPEQASALVNGVSLIYRARRRDREGVDKPPEDVPAKCWWRRSFPSAHMIHYPCGDWNINTLPTMEGREFLDLGYARAYAECRRRVMAHWRHLQTNFDEFRRFAFGPIAPALGVRESRRVRGRCVLTEHDLLAGLGGQKHEDVVALADHSVDTHGRHSGGRPKVRPYGVPYRCLLAKGLANLAMAGRHASFSSLAASSCRLSRTMMQLGQAAGTAAALAVQAKCDLPAVDAARLRSALREDHVQLDLAMSEELRRHLKEE